MKERQSLELAEVELDGLRLRLCISAVGWYRLDDPRHDRSSLSNITLLNLTFYKVNLA